MPIHRRLRCSINANGLTPAPPLQRKIKKKIRSSRQNQVASRREVKWTSYHSFALLKVNCEINTDFKYACEGNLSWKIQVGVDECRFGWFFLSLPEYMKSDEWEHTQLWLTGNCQLNMRSHWGNQHTPRAHRVHVCWCVNVKEHEMITIAASCRWMYRHQCDTPDAWPSVHFWTTCETGSTYVRETGQRGRQV